MVLLVAPAATAGALCQDRARGILAQMATTDLSDSEIVLGKLFSRLAPILALLACALPVVSLAALLGGIDGRALVGLFAVSAAVAVLGCALALSISVEVVKTDEVVMAVLAFVTCWLLSLPLWGGHGAGLWPAAAAGVVLRDQSVRAGVCPVYVAGPLRPARGRDLRGRGPGDLGRIARRDDRPAAPVRAAGGGRPPQVEVPGPGPGAAVAPRGDGGDPAWRERLPGPSLDGNPVLWREWHRSRPSRMARILWGLYWLGAVLATAIGIHDVFAYGIDNMTGGFMIHTALVLQSVLGLMLLSVQAPTALGEERVRGSLDVLMAAPISTRAIVWGKWMGTYRVALGMAVLPGVAAAVIAATCPDVPPRFVAAAAGSRSGRSARPIACWPPCWSSPSCSPGAPRSPAWGCSWRPGPPGSAAPSASASPSSCCSPSAGSSWPGSSSCRRCTPGSTPATTSRAVDLIWIDSGLMAFSPMAAPITTIQALDIAYAGRWQFWVIMSCWCLLAWAFAGAMFWAALRSFDRRLGRMRETSQGDRGRAEPPRLVAVGVGCENEDR